MDFSSLEALVFDRMADTRLPGLSLAIVKGGETIYARGFGQRDLRTGKPATPRTLFGIGSVTKSFTALAIMQLAERGQLDPDDPVDRFLTYPHQPFGEKVRLWHLLTHSSGIPALAYSEALIANANGTGGRWLPISDPADVLTFMTGAQEWEESRPGERWAYANEGYALLGLIVEKVSGRPFNDYVRQEILEPLGMNRSFLDRQLVEADDDVAVPYVLPPAGDPKTGHYLYRRIRSEGGLISNVLDLCEYLRLFLDGGRGIITRESLRSMMEPRVTGPHLTQPGIFGAAGEPEAASHYGFGLATESFLGRRLVGHGGSVLVSTAHLAFLADEGVGVAVLANGSGWPMANFAKAALAVAVGEDPERVPAIAFEQSLDRLTGNYHSFRRTMEARIERQGDFLRLRFAHGGEATLVPERLEQDAYRFFTLSEGRRLPVLFRSREGGGMELVYERYKLRRAGAL